jgi:hypothetical protein
VRHPRCVVLQIVSKIQSNTTQWFLLRCVLTLFHSKTCFGSTYEPSSGWILFLVRQHIQLAMLLLLLPTRSRITCIKIWSEIDCTVFIHSAVYLTTGPKTLPKRALHLVRATASSFKWEYPLLSLRSSSSFLRSSSSSSCHFYLPFYLSFSNLL